MRFGFVRFGCLYSVRLLICAFGIFILLSFRVLSFDVQNVFAQSSFLPEPSLQKPNAPSTLRAIQPVPSLPAFIKDLDALAQQTDPQKALQLEKKIIAHWSAQSKGAALILAQRVDMAMERKQPEIALELISRGIDYQPQWVHGRYMRAMILTLIEDDERAMLELAQILALEPRHFLALKSVANVFEKRKNFTKAYSVYETLEKIHPQMLGLKERMDKLKKHIDGKSI